MQIVSVERCLCHLQADSTKQPGRVIITQYGLFASILITIGSHFMALNLNENIQKMQIFVEENVYIRREVF